MASTEPSRRSTLISRLCHGGEEAEAPGQQGSSLHPPGPYPVLGASLLPLLLGQVTGLQLPWEVKSHTEACSLLFSVLQHPWWRKRKKRSCQCYLKLSLTDRRWGMVSCSKGRKGVCSPPACLWAGLQVTSGASYRNRLLIAHPLLALPCGVCFLDPRQPGLSLRALQCTDLGAAG